jgi:TRAP-type C4-dicarboxylate transport system permease small subunit
VGAALALVFLGVFTWKGVTFTLQAHGNTSPILMLPRPLWYVSMPIAGVMMTWHTLRLGLQILHHR